MATCTAWRDALLSSTEDIESMWHGFLVERFPRALAIMRLFAVEVATAPVDTTYCAIKCTMPPLLPTFILSLRNQGFFPSGPCLALCMKMAGASAKLTPAQVRGALLTCTFPGGGPVPLLLGISLSVAD